MIVYIKQQKPVCSRIRKAIHMSNAAISENISVVANHHDDLVRLIILLMLHFQLCCCILNLLARLGRRRGAEEGGDGLYPCFICSAGLAPLEAPCQKVL